MELHQKLRDYAEQLRSAHDYQKEPKRDALANGSRRAEIRSLMRRETGKENCALLKHIWRRNARLEVTLKPSKNERSSLHLDPTKHRSA